VNESVELVKRARKSSASSLVNAVLRRIASENSEAPSDDEPSAIKRLLPPNLEEGERLGILYSHPTWLVARWLNNFGEAKTIALLEINNHPPHLSCALHKDERREEIFGELKKAGLRVEPGALLDSAFIVSGGSPAQTQAFRQGAISIQDEASQAIPVLLGVQSNQSVLDLCAAPGGKTPPLVRAAGPRGLVVAADRHAHRLRAMRAQFERLSLADGVLIAELDASRDLPFGRQFDHILVDAPCSGTGTLARHPEIRWRLRPEQLSELHALQVAILASATKQVAPGGRLIYSTCSLEPEENEEVVNEVLATYSSIRRVPHPTAMKTIGPYLASNVKIESLFDSQGQFRTSPSEHRTDGFFAAILAK